MFSISSQLSISSIRYHRYHRPIQQRRQDATGYCIHQKIILAKQRHMMRISAYSTVLCSALMLLLLHPAAAATTMINTDRSSKERYLKNIFSGKAAKTPPVPASQPVPQQYAGKSGKSVGGVSAKSSKVNLYCIRVSKLFSTCHMNLSSA